MFMLHLSSGRKQNFDLVESTEKKNNVQKEETESLRSIVREGVSDAKLNSNTTVRDGDWGDEKNGERTCDEAEIKP
jgi:hypothetical protein